MRGLLNLLSLVMLAGTTNADPVILSELSSGPTQCLQTGQEYRIEIEVRRNPDGTCFKNPLFAHLMEGEPFESLVTPTFEECRVRLWAPAFSYEFSQERASADLLKLGGLPCNGLTGPSCEWHPKARKQQVERTYPLVKRGGYTINALIHDTCMAYNFYRVDSENRVERIEEDFELNNAPVELLSEIPLSSSRFLKEVRPRELCVDEFAWAVYDVTGLSPQTLGWVPAGLIRSFATLAIVAPGVRPGDRCTGEVKNPKISDTVTRPHATEPQGSGA